MTDIIAFAGKKQSGKNTATNFIFGVEMAGLDIIDAFDIDEKGRLIVPTMVNGGEIVPGIYDPMEPHTFNIESVWPHIKNYSFADGLKDVCINIMGLTHEQCYGSEENKNSATGYQWKNMPDVEYYFERYMKENVFKSTNDYMTARQVLQYVGTNIFRFMKDDIWAISCMRRIKQDNPTIALISDCRFPDEVDAIHKVGGKVIKLTRNPSKIADAHASEIALDEGNFDQSKFDIILDNDNLSIDEQNQAITEIMQDLGVWK